MAFGKRIRNFFDPASKEPFKLSRSKLENFFRCPRCFYEYCGYREAVRNVERGGG